jgi:hypothetical protein
MADRSKFEKMLELLVNENREAAEELFHEIVVEKSREIYESLLEDEDEEVDEASDDENDDEIDEADEDDLDESDDEDLDEGFDLDEFQVSPDYMGGDGADNFANEVDADDSEDDMGMDGMGMDDMGDAEPEMDLGDQISELSAKFDELLAALNNEDDMDDDENGMDDDENGMDDDKGDMNFGADDEEDDEEDTFPPKESFTYEAKKDMKKEKEKDEKKPAKKTVGEEMREYVEKIGGAHYHQYGKMGDNGTNTKSIVAGKNDMGGTTANILRTDTEQGTEANKGQIKGSSLIKQNPQNMNTGNVNVPGGKAGVKHLKNQNGGGLDRNSILKKDSSDKGAGSMLNGAPKRAK